MQSWYASPQGELVSRLIGESIKPWLEVAAAPNTLGVGFTQPYLQRISSAENIVVGASPAEMGVTTWPVAGNNRIALIHPDSLPFADESFERVVVIHLLEGVESLKDTLRELWRVLVPGGRLLVVVPNRGGWWARNDASPLGWGRPFSPNQLRSQLEAGLFLTRQMTYGLFLPPFSSEWLLRRADAWEKIGQRWFSPLGGLILCEAEKVVYATTQITSDQNSYKRRSLIRPLANSALNRLRDKEL